MKNLFLLLTFLTSLTFVSCDNESDNLSKSEDERIASTYNLEIADEVPENALVKNFETYEELEQYLKTRKSWKQVFDAPEEEIPTLTKQDVTYKFYSVFRPPYYWFSHIIVDFEVGIGWVEMTPTYHGMTFATELEFNKSFAYKMANLIHFSFDYKEFLTAAGGPTVFSSQVFVSGEVYTSGAIASVHYEVR